MSSVKAPAKVLVTGATGFIGAWTARVFLEKGYNVLGTVRSKSKGEWLANQAWAKAASGTFEYIIVEDIEAVGAFDDAVQGDVAVVAHTASPVIFDRDLDPNDLINPAVKGTLGILESIVKHGSAVKRVVITSSVAAILEPSSEPRIYTEEDWNGFSVNEVETKGISSEPMHKYRASKVKAEQATWDFVEKNKGKLNFEVTTILPTMVYGPIIHEIPSVEKLNESSKLFYDNIRNTSPPTDFTLSNFVDVRDVAQMHLEAVMRDEAAGQRFIAATGTYIWQDVYDVLNEHSEPIAGVPIGTPGAGKNVKRRLIIFNTEKTRRILGIQFRDLGEVAHDTLTSFKQRGFWP